MDKRESAVEMVAAFMELAARTAPKAKGIDCILTRIATVNECTRLAAAMRSFGESQGMGFFSRDAGNVAESDACLIIGVRGQETAGVNCRGCGFASCQEMEAAFRAGDHPAPPFKGPNCVLRMADLGIAVGSAVKTAALHNVDNRVMYSAGIGAISLGWVPDCTVAYGIPLKASGKNIFFDRRSS